MRIITSDYVFDNIRLNETRKIIQNTIDEYEEKYGFYLYTDVKVRCVGQFYDKKIYETKNVFINHYNISGELNKMLRKSRGEIKIIKKIEVKIILEGRINKNILDLYFKSGCMPILWKENYGRQVNKRRCLYNKHVNRNENHYCHSNER